MARRLAWGLILFVLPAAGCVSLPASSQTALTAMEEAALYHPSRYPEGNWNPTGCSFEDATFQAEDGVRLHGWYSAAANPRAVVLFAHGNGGNITPYAWKMRYLTEQLGVSVLAFDYRGYGKSDGAPSEHGIVADARAARRWLSQRSGVAERDIVLMGYSLGGSVMVELAARDGTRGLILENTFSSIPDVAAARFRALPVRSMIATRLDSHARIREYHGPLLQTHGDADRVIPFALGKKLFEAANAPKQFIAVPGGGHHETSAPEYLAALNRFFASLPSPVGGLRASPP